MEETASGGVKANPIVVHADAAERVRLAYYRVDAIRRHLEQHEKIAADRLREFFVETVAQADILLNAKAITPEQHDAAIAFVQARRG